MFGDNTEKETLIVLRLLLSATGTEGMIDVECVTVLQDCKIKKRTSIEKCAGVKCILGIVKEANTHFEERQQQLDAFTVQPGGDKRKSNS